MRLSLKSIGELAGEFVIDNKYSIGDYIEVTLLGKPSVITVAPVPKKGDTKVVEFPFRVEFSSEREPFEARLQLLAGTRIYEHWLDCLEVGKTHCVRAIVCTHCIRHTWYVPEIDGWKPGMFGKVKA